MRTSAPPSRIASARSVRPRASRTCSRARPVAARARMTCDYPPIEGAWRQDPARGGGGSLLDLGVHALDLLAWILGPPRRIAALSGSLAHAYAVEDTASLLLELEGDVQA